MLEISTISAEQRVGDFAALYQQSELARCGLSSRRGLYGPVGACMGMCYRNGPFLRGASSKELPLKGTPSGTTQSLLAGLKLVYCEFVLCVIPVNRRDTDALLSELEQSVPGSAPLHFHTAYPQSLPRQYVIILIKNLVSYWRYPQYNAVRFSFTALFALILGTTFWRVGMHR